MFANFVALSSVALSLAAAPQPDTSRIYGRVTTQQGERFEGYIRWDRNEAHWSDILHASKEIPAAYRRAGEALREDRPRRETGIEIFGIRIFTDHESDPPDSKEVGIRFAHILSLESSGRSSARVVLVSGREIVLRSGGDLGPAMRGITIENAEAGIVELPWRDIARVDFMTAPSRTTPRSGRRLFGTVETRYGPSFTGFIAWDLDEALTSDVLDGESYGSDREIPFEDIVAIEQRGNAARVRLTNGEELLLDDSNDVDRSNRGIIITEPSFGQVRVDWENFRRLELHPAQPDLAVPDPIAAHRRITGTVHTLDGEAYSGAIRWDNDEEFAWEFLNGSLGDLELEIEFSAIRSIAREDDASRVTLHDGREWVLDGSNDVDDSNYGLFVTAADGTSRAIAWSRVRRVEFSDRSPAAVSARRP